MARVDTSASLSRAPTVQQKAGICRPVMKGKIEEVTQDPPILFKKKNSLV
jgi:hypothetical protein